MVAQTLETAFKKTDIGAIPKDWALDSLKNLADIKTGAKNTQDKIDDGQYPFFVRSQKIERINTYSFDGEAVLTAGDGVGTGKVFHYITGKFDFHQRVYKISDFSDRLDGYYFFLYFSNAFFNRIMSMTAKSSVDSVRMEMIANMLIPLPEKGEQKAIAKAVNDINSLIESLNRLVEKKKLIKQAAMQELLTGRKRLPGFKGELEIKRLDEISTIYRGASPRPIENPKWFDENSNVGWVRISDVTKSSKYLFNTTQQLSDEGVKNSRFISRNSLIMSICATVGRPIITKISVCIHDGFVVFEKPHTDIEYLYYLLTKIEKKWARHGQTGSQMNLNTTIIGNEKIMLPPTKEEQSAIAQILSDIDLEIEALEQKRDKYRQLKVGIMQQLLTGRIRLKWKS